MARIPLTLRTKTLSPCRFSKTEQLALTREARILRALVDEFAVVLIHRTALLRSVEHGFHGHCHLALRSVAIPEADDTQLAFELAASDRNLAPREVSIGRADWRSAASQELFCIPLGRPSRISFACR